MVLRKAPPAYKTGDKKVIVKFAFKPVRLKEIPTFDYSSFEIPMKPTIIGELIWLERYVETYIAGHMDKGEQQFHFQKSERYGKAFLNKLCT